MYIIYTYVRILHRLFFPRISFAGWRRWGHLLLLRFKWGTGANPAGVLVLRLWRPGYPGWGWERWQLEKCRAMNLFGVVLKALKLQDNDGTAISDGTQFPGFRLWRSFCRSHGEISKCQEWRWGASHTGSLGRLGHVEVQIADGCWRFSFFAMIVCFFNLLIHADEYEDEETDCAAADGDDDEGTNADSVSISCSWL